MEEELLHNKFKNLVVVITGVSSGIGFAVARAYLDRGAYVSGIDVKKSNTIRNKSSNFIFFKCEVQNYKKPKLRFFARLRKATGGPQSKDACMTFFPIHQMIGEGQEPSQGIL